MFCRCTVSAWLLTALFVLCAVKRDKQRRAKTEAREQQQPSTSRRSHLHTAIPAPTSGSDITTGVVTPHGSPMIGGPQSSAHMLFHSAGDRSKNGSSSVDGTGSYKYDIEVDGGDTNGSMQHIRLPERSASSLTGMHSSSQQAVHPSPVSSSGEPFLPNFGTALGNESMVAAGTREWGGEGTTSSIHDPACEVASAMTPEPGFAGQARSSRRASGDVELMKQATHEARGARPQAPVRPPVGTMHVVGDRLASVDSELVQNAAGVVSPKLTPRGMNRTSSHHLSSQEWYSANGAPDLPHSEVDATAHMQLNRRDSAHLQSGGINSIGDTPKSTASGGVRRMKDAVHGAMMEMQHDMQEQQVKVFSVLGRGGYGTVYHGAPGSASPHSQLPTNKCLSVHR
jgi:hypothetical protein